MKSVTKKTAKPKEPIDPAKELVKAQRKIKKLQEQSKMYYAWYEDERKAKDKALKAYNESQYVAKLFKDQCEDYQNRYSKLLEESIDEQRRKLSDQLDRVTNRLKNIIPSSVPPAHQKVSKSTEKNYRLLCIEPGPIEYKHHDGETTTYSGENAPLEYCEVYTTPGPVVDESGVVLYPINEFGGIEMLGQRFVVLEEK